VSGFSERFTSHGQLVDVTILYGNGSPLARFGVQPYSTLQPDFCAPRLMSTLAHIKNYEVSFGGIDPRKGRGHGRPEGVGSGQRSSP
jgi:hypothetical protein